jgi:hypothetical protein
MVQCGMQMNTTQSQASDHALLGSFMNKASIDEIIQSRAETAPLERRGPCAQVVRHDYDSAKHSSDTIDVHAVAALVAKAPATSCPRCSSARVAVSISVRPGADYMHDLTGKHETQAQYAGQMRDRCRTDAEQVGKGVSHACNQI